MALADAEQRAVATLSKLRARSRGTRDSEGGSDTVGMSVEKAPVQRAASPEPRREAPTVDDRTDVKVEKEAGGLLAAKRRAAKRFEED